TPVVATNVGGLAEAVWDRGILVPPARPEELAAGIVRALQDPPPPPALPTVGWSDWAEAILRASRAPRPVLQLASPVSEASSRSFVRVPPGTSRRPGGLRPRRPASRSRRSNRTATRSSGRGGRRGGCAPCSWRTSGSRRST